MKAIVDDCPKAKLLIIGDGPDLQKYKNYVNKHNLDEYIKFTGKVPWDQIPEYYLIADIFTTASTSETQGLTVIEAMAASLPVVCINDESFIDTVINDLNGKIFKNKREYKKAISDLYHDPKLTKKLSKQARISAELHSANQFATSILEVYKTAIKNYPKTNIPLVEKIRHVFTKDKEDKEGDSDE